MAPLTDSRNSRIEEVRERQHFPVIPAPPIRGRETAGRKLRRWILRLAVTISFLGAYF
jgi:hypothetical protein